MSDDKQKLTIKYINEALISFDKRNVIHNNIILLQARFFLDRQLSEATNQCEIENIKERITEIDIKLNHL